jgi:hypothetical protein
VGPTSVILAKLGIVATSAFYFSPLLWGEFLRPREGKKKKKKKQRDFWGVGEHGSNLSQKYKEKKYEGRHIYLEDSF